jgi:hypothetical protein
VRTRQKTERLRYNNVSLPPKLSPKRSLLSKARRLKKRFGQWCKRWRK